MKFTLTARAVTVLLALCPSTFVYADEPVPGTSVPGLLHYAKENNPEFASMRHAAQAAQERVLPAGSLPATKFRPDLMANT